MRRTMMIAAAAILAPLPAAAIAAAESWYRVGGNENSVTYVDASSIRTAASEREAWTLSVFATPIDGRVHAARVHYAFGCAEGYYRSLRYVHLGIKGEELSNHASTSSDRRRTPDEGSISQKMLDFVCNGKGGTPIGDPADDADQVFAASH